MYCLVIRRSPLGRDYPTVIPIDAPITYTEEQEQKRGESRRMRLLPEFAVLEPGVILALCSRGVIQWWHQ